MKITTYCVHCNRFIHGKTLCSDTDHRVCIVKEWLNKNMRYVFSMLRRKY